MAAILSASQGMYNRAWGVNLQKYTYPLSSTIHLSAVLYIDGLNAKRHVTPLLTFQRSSLDTHELHVGGLVQDCSNTSVLATELLQSHTNALVLAVVYLYPSELLCWHFRNQDCPRALRNKPKNMDEYITLIRGPVMPYGDTDIG